MSKSTTNKATTSSGSTAGNSQAAHKATRIGTVESDKRNKTRKVVVAFKAIHPKYGKFVSQRTVLHVHDENNESKLGDTVEVAQCRPVSKTKRWKIIRIVERGNRVELVTT